MLVQPERHSLQLAADLVLGEEIEYAGLDGAFLTHCRLRRWRFCLWNQWLDPRAYPKPPGHALVRSAILQMISKAWRLWTGTRCLVSPFAGAFLSSDSKDALWD